MVELNWVKVLLSVCSGESRELEVISGEGGPGWTGRRKR